MKMNKSISLYETCLEVNRSKKSQSFIRIQNGDNKVWFIPCENMKMGFDIYQPSSKKGWLIKKILPFKLIRRIFCFFKIVTAVDISLNPIIIKFIEENMDIDEFQFSVFCGTPGIHQKTTVQIFKDNIILGYLKTTDNAEIYSFLKKEYNLLQKWENVEGYHKPKPVKIEFISDLGLGMYLQTTEKNHSSKYNNTVNEKIFDAISTFCNETKKEVSFEESDYNKVLQNNLQSFDRIPQQYQGIIEDGISIVKHYLSQEVTFFCGYHGDFTPWNTFFNGDDLFVFDFEYAKESYPALLDLYHFFLQSEFFDFNHTESVILRKYDSNSIFSEIENSDILFICYLVDIILFYVERDGENSWDTNGLNIKRTRILEYLIEREKKRVDQKGKNEF